MSVSTSPRSTHSSRACASRDRRRAAAVVPVRAGPATASWPRSRRFGDATPDTRYAIFSRTKAFVAVGVWLLIGEGTLDVDSASPTTSPSSRPTARTSITVEQVMLHTSGFPRAPLGPPAWYDRDRRLEAFAALAAQLGAGHRATSTTRPRPTGCSPSSSSASPGRDYRDFIDERVTEPLGLPRGCSASADDQDDIAELVAVRRAGDARRARGGLRRAASCPSPR